MLVENNYCAAIAASGEVSLHDAKRSAESIFPWLNLDQTTDLPEAQVRQLLRDKLIDLPPEARKEMLSVLKEASLSAKGSQLGELLDGKLPDVEKEASKGNAIDRLLELLFSLMLLMGKATTERNTNAARMGEVAVNQSQAAGTNTISSANSNLVGSITSLAAGAAIAGIGFAQYNRATTAQIRGIRSTQVSAKETTGDATKLTGPTKSATQMSKDATESADKIKAVDLSKGKKNMQESLPVASDVEKVPLRPSPVRKQGDSHQLDDGSGVHHQDNMKNQFGGQMLASFGPTVGLIAASGFQVQAAGKTAESKINDAHHDVASNMQHNEDQSAQRLSDLMAKLLSVIVSTAQEAVQNVGELSQSIKKA